MPQLTRITRDPAVMGGKPCIRGMRVTVGTVVGLVAAGRTRDEIVREYPCLRRRLRVPVRPVRSSETAGGRCAPLQRPRSVQVSGHPRDDSASPVSRSGLRLQGSLRAAGERTFRLSVSSKKGNREGNRTPRGVFPLYSVSI
jgi:uncharacterized protein (DUF433 family)